MKSNHLQFKFKGIFGILNITEDSFSDGGFYLSPDQALKKAGELLKNGANVLDIGSVSSNPSGKDIESTKEIDRILPVFSQFESQKSIISIDSFNPETQRFFIEKEVGWINDIRGFEHASVYDHLKHYKGRLVLMHAIQKEGRADFSTISPECIIDRILSFFEQRLNKLEQAGINTQKIVLDPGMGFFIGTNPLCSVTVLKNISKLHSFNLDILISVSKKSFLRKISSLKTGQIENVNNCAELMAVLNGANYIRTHNPKFLSEAKLFMDYYFRDGSNHV